jgi:ATP-dependent DNA helicase DinG
VSIRALLGEGGALSQALPAYEARPEQLAMAHAVDTALAQGTPLLVEAGTGTGKSLAYLVPAVRSGLRVVISTATKALGEQLIERDIPTLRRLGLDPDVALVKGLSNYVCLRRLEEHRRAVVTGTVRPDAALNAVLRWVEETETGDRAELDGVADDAPVWRDVVSSSDTRLGAKCRHFERCYVTRMRRRAESAQIIVTNHHLFCADLALRGGATGAQALPDYDAVIFDEAHALEEVATEFFGVRITRARIDTLVRDAGRAFESSGFFVDPSRAQSIGRLLTALTAAATAMFSTLPRAHGEGGRVLLGKGAFEGSLADAVRVLEKGLVHLSEHVRDFVGDSEALLAIARRTNALREALVMATDTASATHVAFCEAEARGGGALGASPVEVGAILRDKLWARRGPVVLTSATLATAGEQGFAFVRRRLGVPEEAPELVLSSPFDYGAQAALYVPRRLPEPRDVGYFAAAVEEIRRLVAITGGGAFVLCTSVRQMRAFAAELRGTWPYPTFIQGETPKQALLARFRAVGDGVLFATASFWEGVDVPGRALRLVIIDKLPFEAPNDPVVAARIQRLVEQGHEPFDEYQVPVAALALKQGFGRLIRTKSDRGIVVILDPRVLTKPYGRIFLNSLPDCPRIVEAPPLGETKL